MKRAFVAVAVGAVMAAAALASIRIQAQTQAQPVSDAIRSEWDLAKKKITDSTTMAEATQAIVDFRPVDTVRTFGQIVAHVAGSNYEYCAAAKGEKAPHTEAAFDKLTAKADIMKAWAGSVAYCDPVYKALTDRSAAETIDMPYNQGKSARASALIGSAGHLDEHYGNLVTYMRIKGIVPPSSRK